MKKWNKENSPVGAHLTDALNLFGADEVRHHGGCKFEGIRHKDGRTIRMITDEGIGSTEYDTDSDIFDEMWKEGGAPAPIVSSAAAALGSISTPKKAASSRENGRKGGRPKLDKGAVRLNKIKQEANNMRNKKIHIPEYPGEFAKTLGCRYGRGINFAPVAAWLVVDNKVQRVHVVQVHGHCDCYTSRTDYIKTTEGISATSTYLFSVRPRIIELEDDFGKYRQWVAKYKN